jgi:squalene synthase HpnC
MYEGAVSHPVFVALRPVVETYKLPIEPFDDLICAFEQDQFITYYSTYSQLLEYCKRSANPVGRLVLYLSECFSNENARLSDQTCTALQLANFWQDVTRDLAIGRVYLPEEDRLRFGVSESDLAQRTASPEFRALLRYEVDRTRELFQAGWPLVSRVPRSIAPSIELFSSGGLAILKGIEKQDYDVLARRPKLSKAAKVRLVTRALAGRMLGVGATHGVGLGNEQH